MTISKYLAVPPDDPTCTTNSIRTPPVERHCSSLHESPDTADSCFTAISLGHRCRSPMKARDGDVEGSAMIHKHQEILGSPFLQKQ